jgi:hypothetical protein
MLQDRNIFSICGGKRMNKKLIGIVIVSLCIVASIVPNIYGKMVDKNNSGNKINAEVDRFSNGKSNLQKFALVLNIPANKISTDGKNILYETELTEDEAVQLKSEIGLIDQKILAVKNSDELKILSEQKLTILRDYNLIPDTFTIDNLNKLTEEIGNGLRLGSLDNTSARSRWTPGFPYVGLGPTVFSYFCLWGLTKPFGWSPLGTTATPIIKLSKINSHWNYSGIFINVSGPFPIIKNQSLKIDNPMWQSLWEINEDGWINYTEMHAMGFYSGQLLIGHTVSIGFAFPDYLDPPTRSILGSFWYFGSPTFPISFTLYQTYPEPPTVIIDIGIVTSLAFSIILPFWFPEPS